MTEPLTIEQIREGLAGHGIRLDPNDETTSCPVCNGVMTLTVTQNGNGPHVECANGCDRLEILGATRAGRHKIAGRELPYNPLQVVRDRLGLPIIERIIKRGRLGDNYELRLADGRIIELGNAATLLSQTNFRARLMPQVRNLPPWVKGREEWDALVIAIEQAAEEIDNVATEAEETRAWLGGWLRQTHYATVAAGDSAELYALLDPPPAALMIDRSLHVRLGDLAAWINRFGGGRVTSRELSARLAALDFERSQPSARHGEKVRKARFWASPQGFEAFE